MTKFVNSAKQQLGFRALASERTNFSQDYKVTIAEASDDYKKTSQDDTQVIVGRSVLRKTHATVWIYMNAQHDNIRSTVRESSQIIET